MSQSFAYLNARIRSRRGQAVPESFFQQASTLSMPDFVRTLGETIYGPDLVGDSLADVDRAVSNHLGRTVSDLPALAVGELRELLSLLLMKADLTNLKAILRGKLGGQPPEEIRTRLTGGTLPSSLLTVLLQAPDAAGVAQLLQLPGHPLAKALRKAVATTKDPLELEVLLDRDFFARVLERARKLRESFLVAYFALEIDALNLATAFKLQALKVQVNPEAYFVPGGSLIGPMLFSRLLQGDAAALESLANTPLGNAARARDLAELERALRRILLQKASQGSLDSLGSGLVLSYVRSKEWEASRIRLLARRAYYNLPVDAVEREVMA
jgi:V/A-type H+-transporting ATPase subunit C